MRRKSIRVAILGVGNCASSLVQGVEFYRQARSNAHVPGLMHVDLGGYHVGTIEFSAAFDVSDQKVGRDLSQAVFAQPNNTYTFSAVPHLNVPVHRGPTMDGLGRYLRQTIHESPRPVDDVAGILRDTGTDVVVSYLPVGSQQATEWYVDQILQAGCGMVNCIPVFIASRQSWRRRFEERCLPIVGDDVKSQVGATITHRMLTNLFRERGVRVDRTYQLNFGGNTDFMNMLERDRLESKKISKTNAVRSQLGEPMADTDLHIGPSDYVPWLHDRKVCYIRMEGTTFGNVPLSCELRMEVWDSPNSAGVVIDAIRCAKLAMDHGIGGALTGPSSYLMKSPPQQFTDHQARQYMEEFIDDVSSPQSTPAADSARRSAVSSATAAERLNDVLEDESVQDPSRPMQPNGSGRLHGNGQSNGHHGREQGRTSAERADRRFEKASSKTNGKSKANGRVNRKLTSRPTGRVNGKITGNGESAAGRTL